jgi:hypothetical protein
MDKTNKITGLLALVTVVVGVISGMNKAKNNSLNKRQFVRRLRCTFIMFTVISIVLLILFLYQNDNLILYTLFCFSLGVAIYNLTSSLNDDTKNSERNNIWLFLIERIYYINTSFLLAVITTVIFKKYLGMAVSTWIMDNKFYFLIPSVALYFSSHIDWLKRGGPLLALLGK